MAGSSRGRGRTAFTFDVGAIGFAKGEALPEAAFKPSALYPPTDFKPIPLKAGENEDYLVALKQEFRATVRNTPYFMCIKNEDRGQKGKAIPKICVKDCSFTILKITSTLHVTWFSPTELEKKGDEEKADEEKKKKDKGEEEEEAEEPEENDEEEHGENDYISSYFEDGDDYGAVNDDNMDEAIY
uniref:DNA-directed RNA polymerase III subunit RPC7 n=1 Tax=Euleptes europaea TaxID=460621 RepID=UPI00253FAF7C|nr:DNA-directed RNA polymerase III subunit RPC7 [Euleptes europaea]